MSASPAHASTPLQTLLAQDLNALIATSRRLGIEVPSRPWHDGLAVAIAQEQRAADEPGYGCGVLEVHEEGFGFLRSPNEDYQPGSNDIYVSQSQIRRFGLRTGNVVIGRTRPPKEQERYPALLRVELIDGLSAEVAVTPFESRQAVHPTSRLPLGRDPWLAIADCAAPLGFGARGVIIGGPRSARGGLLRRLATAFQDDDTLTVIVLLVGERPEEITDWREAVRCEVTATAFDEAPGRHMHVADITFERARRLAERGGEVLLLVDSLSRLLRFAVAEVDDPGHLIDGAEADALLRLREWVATGRDLRDAGSVTVVGLINDADDALSAALLRDLSEALTWQVRVVPAPVGSGLPFLPDLAASFTTRQDRLLSEEDHLRRERWRAQVGNTAESTASALRTVLKLADP